MIGMVEKFVWGLTVLVVAGLGIYLAIAGAPSHWPTLALESQTVSQPEFDKMFPAKPDVPVANGGTIVRQPVKKPSRSPGRSLKKVHMVINTATFDSVAKLADAARVAKSVSSKVKFHPDGSNSLELFGFSENSALGKLGFAENDVLDQIGGHKIDFSSKAEAIELYEEMRDQLGAGDPLVIDVTRNGTPMQIVVGVERD